MPRKSVMKLTMQDHPPLSSRRWSILVVQTVLKLNRSMLRFELGVLDDDRQAGRTVFHNLPAVLTPNSPLSRFLADAFGVRLSERESYELTTLVGRRFQARFDKGVEGTLQAIVAVRSFDKQIIAVARPVVRPARPEEPASGLG